MLSFGKHHPFENKKADGKVQSANTVTGTNSHDLNGVTVETLGAVQAAKEPINSKLILAQHINDY